MSENHGGRIIMKLDIDEFCKETRATKILVKNRKTTCTRHIKIYIHLCEHLQRTEASYHSTREAKESLDLVQTVFKISLLYSYNVMPYEYTILKIPHSLLLHATSVSLLWWQQCCIWARLVVNLFVIHGRNLTVCVAQKRGKMPYKTLSFYSIEFFKSSVLCYFTDIIKSYDPITENVVAITERKLHNSWAINTFISQFVYNTL